MQERGWGGIVIESGTENKEEGGERRSQLKVEGLIRTGSSGTVKWKWGFDPVEELFNNKVPFTGGSVAWRMPIQIPGVG